MTTKKKHLLSLIIAILAVIVIGTGTVTYAWFLSVHSSEFEFQLDSEEQGRVILMYESEISFASGTISTSANVLTPAKAKKTTGIAQGALGPLDVFDEDTVSPAHTGKVQEAASTTHFTASGAYWVGASDTVGELTFSLSAYVKESGVPDTSYDLVIGEEIGYFVVFTYMNEKFLFYNGQFYTNDTESYTLTLPDVFTTSTLRYWKALTSSNFTKSYRSVDSFAFTTDGTVLRLAPNSQFTYDLYVFVAKTDEELDAPYINGKTLQLRATLTVPPLVTE